LHFFESEAYQHWQSTGRPHVLFARRFTQAILIDGQQIVNRGQPLCSSNSSTVSAQTKGGQKAPLPPSGTVTFLFSDIVGSSRRWEGSLPAMGHAVERHESLMRDAIERHHGYVFKTVGDEFCCAFASAADAVHAALDAQLSHIDEDFSAVDELKIRIGLHTGTAQERDGDYFGPTVNRVARLTSIGHGGQVLLSNATHELIKENPPRDAVFTDLGAHQLRDLTQPERVWQARAARMECDFPSLRSLAAFPNNLPLQVTSFYGREDDIQEIKGHVGDHLLVTILGAGGVGKTRLAIQSGAELLDRFDDGVWVADLAPVNEQQSMLSVVAQALGIHQSASSLDHESIVSWLKHKRLLLILDNCEHLLDPVARLVDAIGHHCSEIHMLVTSRQALAITGEKVFRLPSLAVPQSAGDDAPATAIRFSAVALFVDRACLADRAFRLHEENAAAVAAICRRLDGIPLALELAAARLRAMSVSGLAQRLDACFKILTGGSRTALPRQQTLKALIDWSYNLLESQERALFDRLAVFAGSFTLEALENVCCGEGIGAEETLDLLLSLTDKSLVLVAPASDQERYYLLETTRDYACEKLSAGVLRDRFKRRYADYYLSVADDFERSCGTLELGTWLSRVRRESRHFRAVLEWSIAEEHDVKLGASLAVALETYWWHGVEAEGRYWIETAYPKIDVTANPELVARLVETRARLTSRILFS
jgi:predicted ATPase/class 3 adenylate cyclase